MGYFLAEPHDFLAYADRRISQLDNTTEVCVSRDYFLQFSFSLVLLQSSLASVFLAIVSRLLKPFGQPITVSQLLGALILGPSFLGQLPQYTNSIFPARSLLLLDVIASFGFIFYFFLIGVQMDPWIITKINKKALAIGVFTVLLPTVLSTTCSLSLKLLNSQEAVADSLPVVARAESVLSFPTIAYFLAELRMLNSEFGQVALSSSVVSNACCLCEMLSFVLLHQSAGETYQLLRTVLNGIVLVAILLAVRPVVMWMIRRNPVGEPLKSNYLTVLCLAVLMTGFCSHAMGLNLYYGPLILGMILPAGPPVGSLLMERLDPMTSWVFMPLYFVRNGLAINIFDVKLKHYLIVQCIALVAAIGKFLGAFITSLQCQIPKRDAILLGLVMNFQGVVELGMFNLMKNTKAVDNSSFVIMYTFMLLVTGIATPIIRQLYDPSRRYVVYTRRTVMHSRPDLELRILVCIHDQENVPSAINILEALNPSNRSPIKIYMLHFIELVGRATPLLISHNPNRSLPSDAQASEHIVKVFRYMEQRSYSLVSVFPFTAISPSTTMHDNICSVALHRRTSLIMVPFHQQFDANGTMVSAKQAAKITNQNVLDMAPCSVAIIVNRGLLNMSSSLFENWSSYHVAVLFLGGADDREALALGARMAGHPTINLTLIHFLNKNINDDDVKEKEFDKEVLSMFRTIMEGNSQVRYIQEDVIDASGTIDVIRSMENEYELVMVGRNHDSLSPLVSGLTFWNEQRELGAIGDVLASADFMGNTTILVVQQHANIENHRNREGIFSNRNCVEEAKDTPFHSFA